MTDPAVSSVDWAAFPPPPPPALVVDRVSASYGPYRALFGISFTVRAAQVVALLGSNGAGKSTVARVVTGLLPSTSGRIVVDDVDLTGRSAHRIARVGVAHVTEGRGVFGHLTVEENLVLSFRSRLGSTRVPECLERAYDSFPILADRRTQRGSTLSGGQQRILSLAKILVAPPHLLVADELSLGLAPIVVDAVYEGLRKIHSTGTAILVVEQQIDRVLDFASSAVVLEHGSVAYDGPAEGARNAVEQILGHRASTAQTTGARFAGAGGFSPVPREWRWSRRRRQSGPMGRHFRTGAR